jgi:hypothetical protein
VNSTVDRMRSKGRGSAGTRPVSHAR